MQWLKANQSHTYNLWDTLHGATSLQPWFWAHVMCTVPCQRSLPEAPLHMLVEYIIAVTTKRHALIQPVLEEALGNIQRLYTMKTLYVDNRTDQRRLWKENPQLTLQWAMMPPRMWRLRQWCPFVLGSSFSACAHVWRPKADVPSLPLLLSLYLTRRGRVSYLNPELACLASFALSLLFTCWLWRSQQWAFSTLSEGQSVWAWPSVCF